MLPALAADVAAAARRAMTDAGGFELARRCIEKPELRLAVAEPLIDSLGILDIDVRTSADSLFAGAEVCRVGGALAFPYPLAAVLARPPSSPARFLAPIDGQEAWADHADLPGGWVTVDPTGRAFTAEPARTRRNRTLGPFVERLRLGEEVSGPGIADFVLVVSLDCCRILGALEAAHAMAVSHVKDRHQFGQSLSEFQGVQFHVADSVVALNGLRQLAYDTLWRASSFGPAALVDTLALRSYALEVAGTVLWISQLLHGAIGFCDEHDLSIITRTLQGSIRLPTDAARTSALLIAAIDRYGFDGLFSPPASDDRYGTRPDGSSIGHDGRPDGSSIGHDGRPDSASIDGAVG